MAVFPLEIGVNVGVIDEPQAAIAPTRTDTLFLLHPNAVEGSPDVLTELRHKAQARELFDGETDLLAMTDAFFEEGGARMYVAPIPAGVGGLATALGMIGPEHGPGQVIAPTVNGSADQVALADWAWEENRIYIADGPDAATDAALVTLREGVTTGSDGARNVGFEADTLIIPGEAVGTTREIPASVVKAALIARSDLLTGNPNLAAAGVNGECRYVIGIANERTPAERNALGTEQVNTFRVVYGRIRSYGYRTAVDLDALPHWWDLSGSRTIMAVRAREAAVAEANAFSQVDGSGVFLDKYDGALRGELADLQRLGALFRRGDDPGYRVDVSAVVNPLEQLAGGVVTAEVYVRTSPLAESLRVNIIRRPITQNV
jgi:hypothetical protein